MRNKVFVILLLLVLIVSCNSNEVYFKYQHVDAQAWHKDTTLLYNVDIKNIADSYDLNLHIRHTGSYSYQNIWFFIEQTSLKDSTYTVKDTIEYFLADDFGKWYGSGAGSLKELELPYVQKYLFPDTGAYQISIKHAMRDSILMGVNDIGLSVVKVE